MSKQTLGQIFIDNRNLKLDTVKRIALTSLIILGYFNFCIAQCDSGSEPECECSSAELLCSINELDGYSFSMSEFLHPDDGPDPICSGTNNVVNNPTWFSFIAWCEELTLTVEISNCTQPSFSFGAQVAVYEDCGSFVDIACEADDCGNEDDKVLDLDGLVIGEVYHFMIDGCAGSACDVVISVDGSCTEEIEDWTDGITGPTEACAGDVIDYVADDLDGATTYVWSIDGVEDAETSDPAHQITWGTEGTYELCVDAYNECLDVNEDPEEYCVMVTVVEPDAGTITATPNPLCPGETSDFEVTGFNEDPEIEEVIIVVDPNGEVLEVITGGSTGSVTYDECGDVTIYSLNYALYEMLDIPAVGGTYSGTDCTDQCCDETSVVISFEDDEDPVFTNPPADLTLICFDLLPPMEDLDVTDNCVADAIVTGVETGSADLCDGGEIIREWTFADDCGNEVTHTQTITIDPIELPEYVNPPGDVEIICSGTIPDPIDLTLTNNGVGGCLIENIISPIITGQFDVCGSTITYEWDYTDMCGNNLNHIQTIEILPAEEPEFLNPPASITIDCDGTIPDAIDLEYSNGDVGSCLDTGFIPPLVDGSFEQCGTTITYEWDYTDLCGFNINYVQTIEILPALEAEFINPPPDITLTCDEYNSYVFDNLDYSNSQSAPCEIMGNVSPVITDDTDECGGTVEAFYEFEDDCLRTIDHTQTITVEPPAPADFLSMPLDITVDCDAIPDPAEALDYSNGEVGLCLIEGNTDPIIDEDLDECGGTITNTWLYEDDCNPPVEYVQTITVNPAPEAMFESSPSDLDLTCEEFDEFEPEVLTYTNNEGGTCLIEGEIEANVTGVITECGGTLLLEWEFTDLCGRTIYENQFVNVSPAPEPEFINIPEDMTVDCSEASDDLPFLEYDNDASGVCLITGFEQAIPSGAVDECGGVILFTWTFTDFCGRTITENQEVTYLPAEEPEFVDPPEDVTVDCDEDMPDPDFLEYDNDEDAPCEINGEVDPILEVDDNIYTYTWTFTNECTGNTIDHVQVIEKRLPVEFEEDEFEFQICLGNEFDLSTITVFDINNTNPEITFHDELPADSGNEIDPIVILEEEDQEFYILGLNEFDCFDVAVVTGIGEEPSEAGEDIEDEFCIGTELLDLYAFLEFPADLDGEFELTDGPSDLDFAFADEINVSNAEPGFYTFNYFVESDNSCPDDFSEMIIELLEPIDIELLSIACNPDGLTYTVIISNDAYDIDISDGVISSQTDDEVVISNIPITQDLEIEAQNTSTRCEAEFFFQHPDCSCPSVAAPTAISNLQICEGDLIPLLEVTVDVDVIANWYDEPIAGNLLQANTLTYQSTLTTPGIYTFYVEGESTIQAGCVSAVRTPIQLEIIPSPILSDIQLDLCDGNQTGFATIIATDIESVLFENVQNLTATYYTSIDNLNNQLNPIQFPFTNTESNTQTLFYLAANAANCTTQGTITLNVNSTPIINPLFNDETCLGASDGFIDIAVVTPNPPHQIVFEGDTLSTNFINDLASGTYNIEVIDAAGCSSTTEVTIGNGIELVVESLEVNCNDNNTSTDATDDFYIVNFVVQTTINSTGNYNLAIQSQSISNEYAYGEMVSLEMDANNIAADLIFSDVILGCTVEQNIGELTPCSSDCELTLNELTYLCFDNSTPFDPTDDFYEFNINVSAINGNSNNTYNILVDNIVLFSFNYDEQSTFTLPANNSAVTIRVVDSQISNCFISESTTVLSPCSNACMLNAEIIDIMCMDAGTLDDDQDDIFSYAFSVTGINASTQFSIANGSEIYNYGEEITISDNLIATGDIFLEIIDSVDSDCTTTITVSAPAPCSQPCTIVMNNLAISDCDNNDTEAENGDDFFEVSFSIENLDGDVSNVIIIDNLGNNYGPFNYNQTITIGPLPANDQDFVLTISDVLNGTCFLEQNVSQSPCSNACSIDIEILSIECDNNGTQTTNDDDFFTINYIATGINVSNNGFITNAGDLGMYGESIFISNQLISNGSINLQLTDLDNANCFSSIQIDPPGPCSQPCTIDFSYIDILDCNDNGTNTLEDDDFYSVAFNLIASDGNVSSYIISDNLGNTYGPFEYDTDIELGPFDANGVDITLTFSDPANSSCFLEQTISQDACSDACQITAQIVNILCNDNGTVGSNDDDSFTATITVDGINNGSQFMIDALSLNANYNEEIVLGPFEIMEGNVDIIIYDIDAGSNVCMTEIEIVAPAPCSDPCEVELANLIISDCDDNGSGDTEDDDNYSITFEVIGLTGQGGSFNLRDEDGNTYGPFEYNNSHQINDLQADGSLINFTLEDPTNGACTLTFASNQTACSNCDRSLEINANTTVIDCSQTPIEIEITSDITELNTIQWIGPGIDESTTSIDVINEGTYIAIATFIDGCTAEAQISITLNDDTPIAVVTETAIINCENPEAILDGSLSTTTDNTVITWSDSNGNIISSELTHDVTNGGIYTLVLTDTISNCTSNTARVDVQVFDNEPSAVIFANPGNIFDCFIEDIDLSTEQEENVIYNWLVNNQVIDDITVTISDVADVSLIALDTMSLCETQTSITFEDLTAFPIISLSDIESIGCEGEESCIEVTTLQSIEPYEYRWYDENGNIILENEPILCINTPGNYTIELTDTTNGCINESTFTVNPPISPSINLDPVITLQVGDNYQLQPIINIGQDKIDNITWQGSPLLSCSDCLDPFILEFENGDVIQLTVVTIDGCEETVETRLNVIENKPISKYYIPNVFSISDINNRFTIYTSEEVEIIDNLYIYDRWGELMFENSNFEPNNPEIGWDGTFNNKVVEEGVYVYMFKFVINGREEIVAGDITLLR